MSEKKSLKRVNYSAEHCRDGRMEEIEKDWVKEQQRLPGLLDVINEAEQLVPQMADLENAQIYFYAADSHCQYAQVMSA